MEQRTRANGARAANPGGAGGLRRRLLGAGLALSLLLAAPGVASAQSLDEDPWWKGPVRGANIFLDVVLIRPLSVIGLVAGTALFVPAAVMTSPGGKDTIGEAWELFVLVPGAHVWEKPLGEF